MTDYRRTLLIAEDYAGSTHSVEGLQRYAVQVGQVADALSKGDALTTRLIDAVHSGSSAAVEKVFTEVGVDTVVTISTVDGPASTDEVPAGGDLTDPALPGTPTSPAGQSAARSAPTKVRTITVTIGIGPISISVTVKKESK